MDLVPEVTVIVHPVDTSVHPSYPQGWRWAVMLGGRPAADISSCIGALICSEENEAALVGEQAGAAVVKALRAFGVAARFGSLRLDYDPIPAEADEQPIGMWREGDSD